VTYNKLSNLVILSLAKGSVRFVKNLNILTNFHLNDPLAKVAAGLLTRNGRPSDSQQVNASIVVKTT
jgi:hypothetical protein